MSQWQGWLSAHLRFHLILNGLLGLILGWRAFPAILVALALQAFLFQFGGITTLGVNTMNMALPAVICYYLFGWSLKSGIKQSVFITAVFASGFCAVLVSSIFVGLSLYLTGEAFLPAAKPLIAAHLPVMIIEGIVTAACILFLKKVRPELLEEINVLKKQLFSHRFTQMNAGMFKHKEITDIILQTS